MQNAKTRFIFVLPNNQKQLKPTTMKNMNYKINFESYESGICLEKAYSPANNYDTFNTFLEAKQALESYYKNRIRLYKESLKYLKKTKKENIIEY